MRPFQPNSISSLVLYGYLIALLPLAAALVMAVMHMERLAKESKATMKQAVEATQDGRLLISQIVAMERSARQYLVLRSEELLEVYQKTHGDFRENLSRLNALNLDMTQRHILDQLDEVEQELFQVFRFLREKPTPAEVKVTNFAQALELGKDFLTQSSEWVDREVEHLQGLAEDATLRLSWLSVAAVPAVLVLVGIFTALIVKPLTLMARAIYRLGKEDFSRQIAIKGPKDLENLGTQLDWLRQRLKELNEQKSRFLSHMSHEFKTPLTAIREGTEILHDQVVGPLNAEQREVIAILRNNSLQLQQLIDDLLNFNQALSRNLELRVEQLRLDQMIKHVVEVQRLTWKTRKLRITKKLIPVYLTGDREKLETLVDNLLSNAIKFSPPGSTIHIDLKMINGMAQLEVRDSGPGFHPSDKERIFEAFYQGRTVASGHIKGSGLGLAIAREYATIHRGQLEIVQGARPGGCIRLSLPLQEQEAY